MAAKPIPKGYGAVTPYLIVPDVSNLIAYFERSFGAIEVWRESRPDGSIRHAEVRIDGSPVMLGEPTADFGPMPASIYPYVSDCDAVDKRAINAGGESVMLPTNMPSGERYGGVRDLSGNIWWIASHVEDVPEEEQARRWVSFDRGVD
jgi:uncharacterized glyoxalase superfamily protein PhnB